MRILLTFCLALHVLFDVTLSKYFLVPRCELLLLLKLVQYDMVLWLFIHVVQYVFHRFLLALSPLESSVVAFPLLLFFFRLIDQTLLNSFSSLSLGC